MLIRGTIRNKIRLYSLPNPILKALTDGLRLENPTYQQAIRVNPRARYALSEWIKYYEEGPGHLTISNGNLSKLERYCADNGIKLRLEDQRIEVPVVIPPSSIKLRDYQEGVAECWEAADQGIFRLDTGFGKSVLILKMIELMQQKTLIIVPRLNILNQFIDEYRKYFGGEPGVIQGPRFEIKDVTVATKQSLSKRIGGGGISSNEFGAIICDECHLFVPRKTCASVEHFNARYRYGFTATADRSDGQGEAIKFLFGDILIDRKIAAADPVVQLETFNGHIPILEYSEMIQMQIEDEERNTLITDLVIKELDKGRKVLVLTKRVAHYEELVRRIKEKTEAEVYGISARSKEDGARLLDFRGGDDSFDCICGTFSLLSTGFDCPSLDTIVFAGDLKSSVLTTQSAGRCRRIFEGKPTPKIIDIVDQSNGILRNQARHRRETYQRLGWEVV